MIQRFGHCERAQQRMRVDKQFRGDAAERTELVHQFIARNLHAGTRQQRAHARGIRVWIPELAHERLRDTCRQQHTTPLIKTQSRGVAQRNDGPDLRASNRRE